MLGDRSPRLSGFRWALHSVPRSDWNSVFGFRCNGPRLTHFGRRWDGFVILIAFLDAAKRVVDGRVAVGDPIEPTIHTYIHTLVLGGNPRIPSTSTSTSPFPVHQQRETATRSYNRGGVVWLAKAKRSFRRHFNHVMQLTIPDPGPGSGSGSGPEPYLSVHPRMEYLHFPCLSAPTNWKTLHAWSMPNAYYTVKQNIVPRFHKTYKHPPNPWPLSSNMSYW